MTTNLNAMQKLFIPGLDPLALHDDLARVEMLFVSGEGCVTVCSMTTTRKFVKPHYANVGKDKTDLDIYSLETRRA